MNDIEYEKFREQIANAMGNLGRPSKLDNRYFRFQKALGPEKKQGTTVAVYFRDVGANLLELAFETGAVAECIGQRRSQVAEWVSRMMATTGREVHPNPKYNYSRIGIGNQNQLVDILNQWETFSGKVTAKLNVTIGSEGFVRVPFYLESDGSKTLFLPLLKRRDGFQIGEKGSERYFSDYWEALTALERMSVPRFRRPNSNNIPGIVSCMPNDWDEVKRAYIEDQLKDVT